MRECGGANRPVASLPMYDWPEVRAAQDAIWGSIRDHLTSQGIAAPAKLDRRDDYKAVWTDPRLLLSYTCGYPYVKHLRGKVRLVATLSYAAPGCEAATYCSFLLVRRDSGIRDIGGLAGRRAAINSTDSQSGYSALRAVIAPVATSRSFFSRVIKTGGHRASLKAVAEGKADVCATDAVCVALARRHEPDLLQELRVIARSPRAPGLPLITRADASDDLVAALQAALRHMICDRSADEARRALFLDGVEVLGDGAYDRIATLEQRAIALGYPAVR